MLFAAIAVLAVPVPQEISLTNGQIISQSAKVRRAIYALPDGDQSGKSAVLLIRGNNITVDFNGATLRGTPETVEPDQRKGTAIRIEGRNVTIKNLKVHGYRNGIVAFDCPGIRIIDCDLSYNYKPRLASTLEREDLSDWMSYHHNEKDEWLAEKAPPIYLRRCDGFEVKGTRIVGGQNGLMLTECDKGLVWNNNFSFLSAVGLAMYRSSDNRIMHNNIDWCVRGFSYGVYNRGQDSAGILIYEQSNRNVFAYNSVTHGGDGFFLWAGQTTMDTGKGGCNDNLLYGNDFSHAPTNGIEATFSRNNFVNNLILECWHGIWGGYSYESNVVANIFGYNAEGIAWEHGQDNTIERNLFLRNHEDIVIWSNPTQDPNWGYAKSRDTRSRDWKIVYNWFGNTTGNVFRLRRSENLLIERNAINNVGKVVDAGADLKNLTFTNNEGLVAREEPILTGNRFATDAKYVPLPPASSLNQGQFIDTADYLSRFESVRWIPLMDRPRDLVRTARKLTPEESRVASAARYYVEPLKGGINPFLKKGTLRGWRYMLVDEWGPYDFKRPILWDRGRAEDAGQGIHAMDGFSYRNFEVLGPKGKWRVISLNGAPPEAHKRCCGGVEPSSGETPAMIRMPISHGEVNNMKVELEFVGEATVDRRGVVTPAGKPVRFTYEEFFLGIDWNVRWYAWNRASVASPKDKMPTPGELLSRTELREPLKQAKTDRLDYAWGGSPGAPVPADHFITMADGRFSIPNGRYTLNVTTDDGVRVWVDDKLVIDSWKYQGPTLYTTDLQLGGQHQIRVEHYEIDGYAALKVELKPKK